MDVWKARVGDRRQRGELPGRQRVLVPSRVHVTKPDLYVKQVSWGYNTRVENK